MIEESIKVIAYAGYRAEETPRAFFINEARIDVVKVLDHWYEERVAIVGRKRYFKVKGSDSRAHLLYFDEKKLEWFHCS